jgi:hypothetical protein
MRQDHRVLVSGRLAEALLAQQFQPVLVFLPAEQFARTLALALGLAADVLV